MIKFGVFTDLQFADQEPSGKRDYRASFEKFIKMAGFFSDQKLPLILQLGDAMDNGYENLSKVAELFKKSRLPIKGVLGNHDFLVDRAKKKEIKRLLNIPRKGYYSFDLKDPENAGNRWRIVVLDGMEISIPAAQTEEELRQAKQIQEKYRVGGPDGKLPYDWNGALSKKQLDWFENELTNADTRKEKVIVCSHFPLYAEAKSVERAPKVGLFGNFGVFFFLMGVSTWNGKDLLDIIERHSCVKAWFAGHLHEGGFGTRNKIHHVTFKGLVECSCAHAVVTLEEDLISIKGYGDEPDRILKF